MRVARAGFRAARMWIVARGEVVAAPGGGHAFAIDSWPEPLPLVEPPRALPTKVHTFAVTFAAGAVTLRPAPLPGR
ncbi:MAG: hypothetical protein KAI24_13145 [Planctomycetes bacterium]|nr:hypothetical protein [Planctomycetota bacterium]